MTPQQRRKVSMASDQNALAPSEVISLAAPHLAKYWQSTVMMLAKSSLSRRNTESQLVYRSAMAMLSGHHITRRRDLDRLLLPGLASRDTIWSRARMAQVVGKSSGPPLSTSPMPGLDCDQFCK